MGSIRAWRARDRFYRRGTGESTVSGQITAMGHTVRPHPLLRDWLLKGETVTGQYCDLARQYDPFPSPNTTTGTPSGIPVPAWTDGDIIAPLLNKYGKYDLLAYMQKYWISQVGWAYCCLEIIVTGGRALRVGFSGSMVSALPLVWIALMRSQNSASTRYVSAPSLITPYKPLLCSNLVLQ
jgi:hypothetical protein